MKIKYRKKNPQKQGRILEREEEFFWLARIYIPELAYVKIKHLKKN